MSATFAPHSQKLSRSFIIAILMSVIFAAMLSAVFISRVEAVPDTCTWTGNISNDMNDANNWTGCDNFGIPENGDSYVFPQTANNKNLSIDSFAVNPVSMSFTGTGYSLNRSGSQTLTFLGSGVAIEASQNVDINVPVTFGNGSLQNTVLRAAEDTTITFTSTVGFDTGIGEINIGSAGYIGGVVFEGAISGTTSQFIAQNDAYVEITSSGNNYVAATVGAESGGSFRCSSVSCFGDSANDIYTGGGAVALLVSGTFTNDIVTSTPTTDVSQINAFEDILLTGDVTISSSMRFVQAGTGSKTLELASIATVTIEADQSLGLFGNNAAESTIELSADVDGPGGGIQVNNVTAVISGANSFTGGVGVGSEGVVQAIGTDSSLGDANSTSTVADGGALEFDQLGVSATLPWDLVLSGEGPDGQGAMSLYSGTAITYTGDINLDGPTTIGVFNSSANLSLNRLISGNGDLTFTSDGTGGIIAITGTEVNDYVGDTFVDGVRLNLTKTGGLGVTGDIFVSSDATRDALLVVNDRPSANQVADDAIIDLDQNPATNVYFGSFNPDEVIGSLTGNGNYLTNGADQGVTIGGGDKSGTFSGLITNSSAFSTITKIGSGTWTLSGASYGGVAGNEPLIIVEEGNVIFDSDLPDFTVTVGNGGVLKGTGSVGSTEIESGGTLSTGNSPGCLTLADLTLNGGSIFVQDISGSTACSGYDQTAVTGNTDLGNATLNATLDFKPAAGTVFTIVSSGSLTGTFAGLPEGSVVSINGERFRINYTSTSVTLTSLSSGNLPATGSNLEETLLMGFVLILFGGLAVAAFRRRKCLVF